MVCSLERSCIHIHRKLFVTSWLCVHTVSEASPADTIINHLFKGPQSSLCHLLHDFHNYCCKTDRQDFEPDRQDTMTRREEIQQISGVKVSVSFLAPTRQNTNRPCGCHTKRSKQEELKSQTESSQRTVFLLKF